MSKTVQSVKNSLKFKAQPKAGILSVRVGVKKYPVPVEARILSNGDFIFLSFPACSELFKVDGKNLVSMPAGSDATEAYNALNPTRKGRGRRKSAGVTLPPDLEQALRGIPPGYKLGYDADGNVRLVRKRSRREKK